MVIQALNITDFPTYEKVKDVNPRFEKQALANYLQGLISAKDTLCERYLFLPPLRTLSRFFQESPLELLEVFQLMKKRGYDYLYLDLDTPITFWNLRPYPTKKHPGTKTALGTI